MQKTVILGAGLSGLSTAFHLKRDYDLFERAARPGGLVVTEEREGFHFDVTGHWLHMRDPQIRQWITTLLAERLVSVRRDSRIWSKGVYTAYPFQTNTYGLPLDVVKEIIGGFVRARYETKWPKQEPKTFEEWVLRYMGEGIAKHFMLPYNHKLWVSPPSEMTPHWCQHYVPKPTLDELLEGALRPPQTTIGYNAGFVYPQTGGIGELSLALASAVGSRHVHYQIEPTAIHAAERRMSLSDGRTLGYEQLVSSIPLPELVALIEDAPSAVKNAAAKLLANQVAYFNIGLDAPAGNPAHWVYYPESDSVFYRAGCYSNAVPAMAPAGGASLYVEISHRGQLPPQKELWKSAQKALLASGYVKRAKDVRFVEFRNIPCAYVVFDAHYAKSLALITTWLASKNIHPIGRYGRWTYNSMETALIDGREIARRIRERD